MIIEFFVQVATGFVGWLGTMFPVLDLPDQVVNADDQFNNVMGLGDGLGAFVDWPFIGTMAAIPITLWLGGLAIRGVRVLISHIPYFGGRG